VTNNNLEVLQTRSFTNIIKKLHTNQKFQLDKAIRALITNPCIGELKKGDLSDIRVYKFHMINQLMLLAYIYNPTKNSIALLTLGSHENFYRHLKNIHDYNFN
jgi:mRNA-degrading endonuclease YafQ of YafQ-DinJ toxin-antitoxin module